MDVWGTPHAFAGNLNMPFSQLTVEVVALEAIRRQRRFRSRFSRHRGRHPDDPPGANEGPVPMDPDVFERRHRGILMLEHFPIGTNNNAIPESMVLEEQRDFKPHKPEDVDQEAKDSGQTSVDKEGCETSAHVDAVSKSSDNQSLECVGKLDSHAQMQQLDTVASLEMPIIMPMLASESCENGLMFSPDKGKRSEQKALKSVSLAEELSVLDCDNQVPYLNGELCLGEPSTGITTDTPIVQEWDPSMSPTKKLARENNPQNENPDNISELPLSDTDSVEYNALGMEEENANSLKTHTAVGTGNTIKISNSKYAEILEKSQSAFLTNYCLGQKDASPIYQRPHVPVQNVPLVLSQGGRITDQAFPITPLKQLDRSTSMDVPESPAAPGAVIDKAIVANIHALYNISRVAHRLSTLAKNPLQRVLCMELPQKEPHMDCDFTTCSATGEMEHTPLESGAKISATTRRGTPTRTDVNEESIEESPQFKLSLPNPNPENEQPKYIYKNTTSHFQHEGLNDVPTSMNESGEKSPCISSKYQRSLSFDRNLRSQTSTVQVTEEKERLGIKVTDGKVPQDKNCLSSEFCGGVPRCTTKASLTKEKSKTRLADYKGKHFHPNNKETEPSKPLSFIDRVEDHSKVIQPSINKRPHLRTQGNKSQENVSILSSTESKSEFYTQGMTTNSPFENELEISSGQGIRSGQINHVFRKTTIKKNTTTPSMENNTELSTPALLGMSARQWYDLTCSKPEESENKVSTKHNFVIPDVIVIGAYEKLSCESPDDSNTSHMKKTVSESILPNTKQRHYSIPDVVVTDEYGRVVNESIDEDESPEDRNTPDLKNTPIESTLPNAKLRNCSIPIVIVTDEHGHAITAREDVTMAAIKQKSKGIKRRRSSSSLSDSSPPGAASGSDTVWDEVDSCVGSVCYVKSNRLLQDGFTSDDDLSEENNDTPTRKSMFMSRKVAMRKQPRERLMSICIPSETDIDPIMSASTPIGEKGFSMKTSDETMIDIINTPHKTSDCLTSTSITTASGPMRLRNSDINIYCNLQDNVNGGTGSPMKELPQSVCNLSMEIEYSSDSECPHAAEHGDLNAENIEVEHEKEHQYCLCAKCLEKECKPTAVINSYSPDNEQDIDKSKKEKAVKEGIKTHGDDCTEARRSASAPNQIECNVMHEFETAVGNDVTGSLQRQLASQSEGCISHTNRNIPDSLLNCFSRDMWRELQVNNYRHYFEFIEKEKVRSKPSKDNNNRLIASDEDLVNDVFYTESELYLPDDTESEIIAQENHVTRKDFTGANYTRGSCDKNDDAPVDASGIPRGSADTAHEIDAATDDTFDMERVCSTNTQEQEHSNIVSSDIEGIHSLEAEETENDKIIVSSVDKYDFAESHYKEHKKYPLKFNESIDNNQHSELLELDSIAKEVPLENIGKAITLDNEITDWQPLCGSDSISLITSLHLNVERDTDPPDFKLIHDARSCSAVDQPGFVCHGTHFGHFTENHVRANLQDYKGSKSNASLPELYGSSGEELCRRVSGSTMLTPVSTCDDLDSSMPDLESLPSPRVGLTEEIERHLIRSIERYRRRTSSDNHNIPKDNCPRRRLFTAHSSVSVSSSQGSEHNDFCQTEANLNEVTSCHDHGNSIETKKHIIDCDSTPHIVQSDESLSVHQPNNNCGQYHAQLENRDNSETSFCEFSRTNFTPDAVNSASFGSPKNALLPKTEEDTHVDQLYQGSVTESNPSALVVSPRSLLTYDFKTFALFLSDVELCRLIKLLPEEQSSFEHSIIGDAIHLETIKGLISAHDILFNDPEDIDMQCLMQWLRQAYALNTECRSTRRCDHLTNGDLSTDARDTSGSLVFDIDDVNVDSFEITGECVVITWSICS